jgi:hypothetical protein
MLTTSLAMNGLGESNVTGPRQKLNSPGRNFPRMVTTSPTFAATAPAGSTSRIGWYSYRQPGG